MGSIFDDKMIIPMKVSEGYEITDSPDFFYELKLDGERCIAYLDPGDEAAFVLPGRSGAPRTNRGKTAGAGLAGGILLYVSGLGKNKGRAAKKPRGSKGEVRASKRGILRRASKKGSSELRSGDNLPLLSKYPELRGLHKSVTCKCILDGEIISREQDTRGYLSPGFVRGGGAVSPKRGKRAKRTVTFAAFDILFFEGKDVCGYPLEERRRFLSEALVEDERVILSRVINDTGSALYRFVESEGLNGLVAKRKMSLYFPGRISRDWTQVGFGGSGTFIVCGFIYRENFKAEIILGQFEDEDLVYKGRCLIDIDTRDFEEIYRTEKLGYPPFELKPENCAGAVWLHPELNCVVRDGAGDSLIREKVFMHLEL
ncbi:MAG: hypothetical protein LBL09_04925 [Oscillospiraceae bacterium]|jgi:ATP-dependent DNA ligase|nr:hypothetical protein [Oscillospiraceae bacterium]